MFLRQRNNLMIEWFIRNWTKNLWLVAGNFSASARSKCHDNRRRYIPPEIFHRETDGESPASRTFDGNVGVVSGSRCVPPTGRPWKTEVRSREIFAERRFRATFSPSTRRSRAPAGCVRSLITTARVPRLHVHISARMMEIQYEAASLNSIKERENVRFTVPRTKSQVFAIQTAIPANWARIKSFRPPFHLIDDSNRRIGIWGSL